MKRKASESLPVQRLRHHVTGAIERGEAQVIAGIPAIAPETAQNATIPAGEGEDTAPTASDLVVSLENLATCAGIVAEFAPAHGLPAATVAELAKFAPELRRISAEVATLEQMNVELVSALINLRGEVLRRRGETLRYPHAETLLEQAAQAISNSKLNK